MYDSGQSVLKKNPTHQLEILIINMCCKTSLVTSSPVFMSEKKFKTWLFHAEILED